MYHSTSSKRLVHMYMVCQKELVYYGGKGGGICQIGTLLDEISNIIGTK